MIERIIDCRIIVLILTVGLYIIGVASISNAEPTFPNVGATATRSVDENAAIGTNVGDSFYAKQLCFDELRFKFPKHTDKFEYVVSSDNELDFDIQIKTKVSLDYETATSYTVVLKIEFYDWMVYRWIETDFYPQVTLFLAVLFFT